MGEKSFEQEVLERLTAIETNGKYFAKGLEVIEQHSIALAEVKSSSRSAHKRLDGIYATAALLGGVVSFVVQLLWPKGGH